MRLIEFRSQVFELAGFFLIMNYVQSVRFSFAIFYPVPVENENLITVTKIYQSYIVLRLFALCSFSSLKKYVTFKVKK